MAYGDEGGATGWLIGEENKGMAAMFTMMNNARLNVGLQGVSIAERATQQAVAYARERVQGSREGRPARIIEFPDVRRMLLQDEGADPGRAGAHLLFAPARPTGPASATRRRGRAPTC